MRRKATGQHGLAFSVNAYEHPTTQYDVRSLRETMAAQLFFGHALQATRKQRSCVATQTPHEPSAQAIAQQLGKRCIIVRGATASPFEVAIPKRKKKCS